MPSNSGQKIQICVGNTITTETNEVSFNTLVKVIKCCDEIGIDIGININLNKLFQQCCENGNLEAAKKLVLLSDPFSEILDIHANNDAAFTLSCCMNHLDIVQWLVQLGEDMGQPITKLGWNNGFSSTIKNGHLEVAQWMVKHTDLIDIKFNGSYSFSVSCTHDNLDMTKWLLDLSHKLDIPIDIHAYDERAFRWSLRDKQLEVSQWLIQLGNSLGSPIDLHAMDDNAFRMACHDGDLLTAKWLVEIAQTISSPIDIHTCHEYAFRHSCEGGYLDLAKWLFSLGLESGKPINIHAMDDYAFHWSMQNQHDELVKWLANLDSP